MNIVIVDFTGSDHQYIRIRNFFTIQRGQEYLPDIPEGLLTPVRAKRITAAKMPVIQTTNTETVPKNDRKYILFIDK